MGMHDDGVELGLWGNDGIPNWDDESSKNLEDNEYNVILSPKKYLHDNGTTIGSEVHTREEVDQMHETYLELQHDRYNVNDKLAIKVLYKDRFIGYIYKNHNQNNKLLNKNEINSKCFNTKDLIKDITLIKKNKHYILRTHGEKTHFTSNFEKVEKILHRDRNIKPLKSEKDTIVYALENKNTFSFTEEDLDILISRKVFLFTNSTGKVIGSAAKSTLAATEKTLATAEKVVGSIFKKFF